MASTTTTKRTGRFERPDPAARGQAAARSIEWGTLAVLAALLGLAGVLALFGVSRRGSGAQPAEGGGAFRPLVADFRGTVEYRPSAGAWRPLRLSDRFSEGDSVRCAADASCDVFLDLAGARIVLDRGTEIRWKRLTDDAGARKIEVDLSSGRVLHGLPAGFPFEVSTRGARARVRGASGSVGVGRRGTMVSVLSGFVEVVDATDPSRRVQAAAGTAVDLAEGGAEARPLTAEERARLAREAGGGPAAVRRAAPRADEATPEAEPTALRGAPTTGEEPGAPETAGRGADETAPGKKALTGEAAAVADVLRRGLRFLDEGSVSEALALATPTFRAFVQGSLSGQSAATTMEVSRADAVQAAQRLASSLSLRLRLQSLDATLDGDVAWGSAVVLATATLSGTGKILTRSYSCLARCVRSGEGWLVDLVTASEGG